LEDCSKFLDISVDFKAFLESDAAGNETDGSFEEKMSGFWELRNKYFDDLKVRSVCSVELRKVLQTFPREEIPDEFTALAAVLQQKMEEILRLDEFIVQNLKLKLENVRMEIHRLQNTRVTTDAYRQNFLEARFIDRKK